MRRIPLPCFVFLLSLLLSACANVVPPSGGPKDQTPPRLLTITPADSQLNSRVTQVKLTFDEYIMLNNPATQIQLSPLIPVPLDVSLKRKTVTVKIPDSLLSENTTYQLSFGAAIQDLHESNPFPAYNYLFSTGSYFDSLGVSGIVFDAATGLPDSAALVMLYALSAGDSAIVKQKPLYVTHADAAGNFQFKGLPSREFTIYALHDLNANLIYDGGSESIGFYATPIRPMPDTTLLLRLNIFIPANADTTGKPAPAASGRQSAAAANSKSRQQGYQVMVDTANNKNRTFDVNRDLIVQLADTPATFLPERIFLSYDSAGISMEAFISVTIDTLRRIHIKTNWKEDVLYELRLQKGFATDSAGNDLLPGTYSFRTKRNEDYGTIRLRLPSKYQDSTYLLQVYGPSEKELYYSRPVTDTLLVWKRLPPGPYSIRIIHDENKNGVWDSGTLFPKKQPEVVIPYSANPVRLREGWENEIDFEKR